MQGRRKILFGSDGPWLHPGVELAKVQALELSEPDKRAVLAGNLLRLIAPARRRAGAARQPDARSPADEEARDPWQVH